MATHGSEEAFALLQPGSLQRIALMPSVQGSTVEIRSARPGDSSAPIARIAGGDALRPPSPVHLQASQTPGGSLTVSWVRRSRHGWAWLDEIDAPLGEASERYRVALDGTGGRIELETGSMVLVIDPGQLASVGTGSATLSIQQVGDLALSRAATLSIILS
jgi:hypothetical protein